MNWAELYVDVLDAGGDSGELCEPTELVAATANLTEPIRSLSDFDVANVLFATLQQRFGFIGKYRNTGVAPSPDERQIWASLIRWVIQELRSWRKVDDINRHKLAAIFVVTEYCDWDGFWTALPDYLIDNVELSETLGTMVSSLAALFSARQGAQVPIWEAEALDKLKLADAQGDWVQIEQQWRLFENHAFPNMVVRQMVRCFYRCDYEHFVEKVAALRSTPVTILIAQVLTVDQRLRLANASNNPYIQFSCAYCTLSHSQDPLLSSSEIELLTNLLVNIAADDLRWAAWMQVFNTYPLRYPAIQVALGRTLATINECGIEAYIESIRLSAITSRPDPNRDRVAECLHEFHQKATLERRKTLWTSAYRRWAAWNFDQQNRDGHMFSISWSGLDYAVVGYVIECLNEVERDAGLTAVRMELTTLDSKWYSSFCHCITAWNRLLSQFQIYAHASDVNINCMPWSIDDRTYRPMGTDDDYVKMMFRP